MQQRYKTQLDTKNCTNKQSFGLLPDVKHTRHCKQGEAVHGFACMDRHGLRTGDEGAASCCGVSSIPATGRQTAWQASACNDHEPPGLLRLYHRPMPTRSSLTPALHKLRHAWQRQLASGWFMLQFGAVVLVLALTPSTHTPAYRAATARHIYTSTWQVLPWFTALSALLSLVLIRIVVVTALSYGLSQYALQMVVRVLVLELIPLSAAMFVALRTGLAFNAGTRPASGLTRVSRVGDLSLTYLRSELTPRVLADAFSVLALAMVSSLIALVLTYLMVYGPSPWGLPGFTRTVGQVFDLTVSLGFILKAFLFSMAVAVVPLAASLEHTTSQHSSPMQPGAVRLFLVLLALEAASLAVKYV